eukprot:gene6087-12284_t
MYFRHKTQTFISHVSKHMYLNARQESALSDSFGRFHNYLRISLTEKCNLRCVYCMPLQGVDLSPKEHLLTLDECKSIIRTFSDLGVTKLRFTGGEPTISRNLRELVQYSSQIPTIKSVGITTNGIILGSQLDGLVDAGVTSINISLDTLIPARFGAITRRDEKLIYRVLSAVHAAVAKGVKVKVSPCGDDDNLSFRVPSINCVVMRGVNLDEIAQFVELSRQVPVDVRFIEVMPFDHNNWNSNSLVSYIEILDLLKQQVHAITTDYDIHDTTKWYTTTVPSSSTAVSAAATNMDTPFPSTVDTIPTTSHFCAGCNRLRITADGKLKVCLFGEEEWNLRDVLRNSSNASGSESGSGSGSGSESELVALIRSAVTLKKRSLGGHSSPQDLSESKNRPMILIGG